MSQPRQAIRDDILRTIQEILEPWITEMDSITEETNLITDVGIDSVGILQAILHLESEYSIKIPEYELNSEVLTSVSIFIDYIESKINAIG